MFFAALLVLHAPAFSVVAAFVSSRPHGDPVISPGLYRHRNLLEIDSETEYK